MSKDIILWNAMCTKEGNGYLGQILSMAQESAKPGNVLDFFNTYKEVINAGLMLITILVSLATVIVTAVSAKSARKDAKEALAEQKRQYEESLKNQAEQYKADRMRVYEIERIHEQPYLIFLKSWSCVDLTHNCVRLYVEFVNKGRGTAYGIQFDEPCKATSLTMSKEFDLTQEAFDKCPIAMINEPYKTQWKYNGEELACFSTKMLVQYTDASGRQYKQAFSLTFQISGEGTIINTEKPKLCDR